MAKQWAAIQRTVLVQSSLQGVQQIFQLAPEFSGFQDVFVAAAGCGAPGVVCLLSASNDSCRSAGERRAALAALGRVPMAFLALSGQAPVLATVHASLQAAAASEGVFSFPGADAAALHALASLHRQLRRPAPSGNKKPESSNEAVFVWMHDAMNYLGGSTAALASTSALLGTALPLLGNANRNTHSAAVRTLTSQEANTKHQGVLLLLHVLRTSRSPAQRLAAADALSALRVPWLLRTLLSAVQHMSSDVAASIFEGLESMDAHVAARYILHKRSVMHAMAVLGQARRLLQRPAPRSNSQGTPQDINVLPFTTREWLQHLVNDLQMSALCRKASAERTLPNADSACAQAQTDIAADTAEVAAALRVEVEAMLARRLKAQGGRARGGAPATEPLSPASVVASEHSSPASLSTASAPPPVSEEQGLQGQMLNRAADSDPLVSFMMDAQQQRALSREARKSTKPATRGSDWELAGNSQLYSPSRLASALPGRSSFELTSHSSRGLLRDGIPASVSPNAHSRIGVRVAVGEPLSPGE
jgi:hypothetical protein